MLLLDVVGSKVKSETAGLQVSWFRWLMAAVLPLIPARCTARAQPIQQNQHVTMVRLVLHW